ncbi:MAG: Crp/Fnr family transcriptional regulator [Bacteroidales bacterium]|nr:Crp/Fnr family transcriptional regulator [Bacteroidales bacterium]
MKEHDDFLREYGFSKEVQEAFSSMGQIIEIKKGEKLLHQGNVCLFVALIVSGRFRIYHDFDGKESTIGLSFDFFITDYSSFVTGKPSEVNIVALVDSKLLLFQKTEIEMFFDFNKETQCFGRKIAEQIMVSNQNALFSLLYDSAEDRYKKLIKQHPHLLQLFSLKDIAECIGVTPETVSRIRKKILYS